MGYEIKYRFHPRNEDGSYSKTISEKETRVGKPFDDTPLEKCAASIMAQLARRDIWVVDVEVYELVKKQISFKESKDARGIVLKNKRFSLNSTAEMITEVVEEEQKPVAQTAHPHETKAMHPHERITHTKDPLEQLYNPNAVVQGINARTVNQNKKLYQVMFDPGIQISQIKKMKIRLTDGKKYFVHQTNKTDIAITDDAGQVLVIDEKYFSAVGQGLLGDAELGFSAAVSDPKRPKLAFENEMHFDHPAAAQHIPMDAPIDDGEIPQNMLQIPDLRPGKKF